MICAICVHCEIVWDRKGIYDNFTNESLCQSYDASPYARNEMACPPCNSDSGRTLRSNLQPRVRLPAFWSSSPSVVGGSGAWSITLASLIDGNHPLTAVATDVAGTASAHSSVVTVAVDPTQNIIIPDQSWVGGSPQTFPVPNGTFEGPSSDTLTYTATGLPFWASINSATGAVTGTIPMAASGSALIAITATDNHGDSITGDFNLAYVGPPPSVPTVEPQTPPQPPPPTPVPNMAPTMLVTVVNEDSSVVTGTGSGTLSISSSWTGVGGTPQNSLSTLGPPSMPPTSAGLTAPFAGGFQTEVLKVTISGIGDLTLVKPLVEVLPNDSGSISYGVGTDTFAHSDPTAVIHLTASLANGDPLPAWMQFNPQSGTITGQPPASDDGQMIEVLVTAIDNLGHKVIARIQIDLGSGLID